MFPDSGNEKGSEVSNSTPRLSQKYCQFEFDEILLATDNFNESLVVGKGGFGKVYKGNISIATTHVDVAIKRLDLMSNQGATEFWAEVEMLSELRHAHLVSLIGYCNYEKEMILVYEYMPHGTLEDHLHKLHTPLSWLERLKICIGAARGLDYLHTGTGIEVGVIHRDVKSSNILLHESWAAKISDFGLARIGPTNQPATYVNTLVKGTFGYIDPNYFATGKLTRKSDVYAFGVVLFEVLCQKRPLDESFECGLATWVQESIKEGNLKQIVYSGIRSEISPKCLKGFVRIAERCLDNYPNHRPTMTEVVYSLESLLAQSLLSSKPKTNNWLQTPGKKIFGRIFDVFPFSAPGENSISTPISGGEKSALSFIEHDEFLPASSTNDVQSYLPQGMGNPYPYPKVARLFPEGLSAILQGVRIEHFGSVSTGNNLLLKALRAVTRKRLKNGNVSESMSFSAKELAFLEDDNALLGMEIIQESRYGDLFKTDIMKGGMLKTIAIKRIIHPPSETTKHNVVDLEKYSKKMRQIRSEIKTVGLIRHQNILPLLAHVSRTTCHYLVYEFMKFGSLQDILLRVQYGRQELEWIRRHKIAIGVANGLEYLHLSLPLRIVHRNLTPATIILDDNMEARISDFGLSRQIPHAKATIRSPDVAGSLGYIAPEYHQTLEFNEKVDIYSFGLLLGVLVVGKLPSDDFFPHTGEQSMVRWMRKVMTSDDQKEAIHLSLLGNGYEEQMLRVLKIACFCTLDNPEERPTSKDCRIMLSQIEH